MEKNEVCGSPATLTQAELDRVDALPDGAHVTQKRLNCELQAGHPDSHLALAQAYGKVSERSLWLRWGESVRGWLDIEDGAHCQVEGPPLPDMGDNELCELPGEHPGRHSFELH